MQWIKVKIRILHELLLLENKNINNFNRPLTYSCLYLSLNKRTKILKLTLMSFELYLWFDDLKNR